MPSSKVAIFLEKYYFSLFLNFENHNPYLNRDIVNNFLSI